MGKMEVTGVVFGPLNPRSFRGGHLTLLLTARVS